MLTRNASVAQGDFLAATQAPRRAGTPAGGQGGPLILDNRAQPVWFLPESNGGSLAFQEQTYQGKPVLMWFAGQTLVIVDEHYHRVATLKSRAPWGLDPHDAYIAGGDIWVSVARIVKGQNLTRYGGPRHGSVLDVGLQEIQISTDHVIRTWDALNPSGKATSRCRNPRCPPVQGAGAARDHRQEISGTPTISTRSRRCRTVTWWFRCATRGRCT